MEWTAERIAQLAASGRLYLFYNSSAWRGLKAEVLRDDHHECVLCRERKHRHTRATTVHHVNHVRKHPDLALSKYYTDESGRQQRQLLSLCDECHAGEHPEERWRAGPKRPPVTPERW